MSISDFSAVIVRELRAARVELEAYPDEALIWKVVPGISNSAGTLVLHLCGNLRHFVGQQLGSTEYARDRDAEFSRRDVPRAELIDLIETTCNEVEAAIGRPEDARLSARYPTPIGGRLFTTSQFLVHLVGHLGYHLGQIDYHRRMLDESATAVGTLSLEALPSVEPPPDTEEFAARATAERAESLLPSLDTDPGEPPPGPDGPVRPSDAEAA